MRVMVFIILLLTTMFRTCYAGYYLVQPVVTAYNTDCDRVKQDIYAEQDPMRHNYYAVTTTYEENTCPCPLSEMNNSCDLCWRLFGEERTYRPAEIVSFVPGGQDGRTGDDIGADLNIDY